MQGTPPASPRPGPPLSFLTLAPTPLSALRQGARRVALQKLVLDDDSEDDSSASGCQEQDDDCTPELLARPPAHQRRAKRGELAALASSPPAKDQRHGASSGAEQPVMQLGSVSLLSPVRASRSTRDELGAGRLVSEVIATVASPLRGHRTASSHTLAAAFVVPGGQVLTPVRRSARQQDRAAPPAEQHGAPPEDPQVESVRVLLEATNFCYVGRHLNSSTATGAASKKLADSKAADGEGPPTADTVGNKSECR